MRLSRSPSLDRLVRAARADRPDSATRRAWALGPAANVYLFRELTAAASSAGPVAGAAAAALKTVAGAFVTGVALASVTVTVAGRAPWQLPEATPTAGAHGRDAARRPAPAAPRTQASATHRELNVPRAADASTQPRGPRQSDAVREPAGVPGRLGAAVEAPATLPVFDSHPTAVIAEAELVESARRALRQDPARALGLTLEHERRFPRGQARTENAVIAIEALVALGRLPEARVRLGAFEAAHPNSLHLPRLRSALDNFAGDR